MPVSSTLPVLALLPSALAVPLIVLSRRWPALRETWSVLAAVSQTLIVVAMVPVVLSGVAPVSRPLSLAPGIPLELRADAAGVFFALVASTLWILTTIYSIGYTRAERERRQTRYFAAFAVCLFATVGIALAGNLLTFYVFYELLTVGGYPLVIHRSRTRSGGAWRCSRPSPGRSPSRATGRSRPEASCRPPAPRRRCSGCWARSSSWAAA
jgi:multicomponent Na+:H+ antiporter subunit D